MNCQTFQETVNELARAAIMDAVLQEEALRHNEQCPSCASKLAGERRLTNQLRELARSMDSVSVPKRIEHELLEAFAQSVFARPQRRFAHRKSVAAIAALLLIAFGLFILRARLLTERAGKPASAVSQIANVTPQAKEASLLPLPDAKRTESQLAKAIQRPASSRSPATHKPSTPDSTANRPTAEVATDFIPVTYSVGSGLDAGAQVVRVQLPRSAMANFGLPVNVARADEPVKADVLLGADGLARAIRFVQ